MNGAKIGRSSCVEHSQLPPFSPKGGIYPPFDY